MSDFNPILQFQRRPLSRVCAVRAKYVECVGCTPYHLVNGFKETISACFFAPGHCIDSVGTGRKIFGRPKLAAQVL
jgi:hypothetical protein